MTWYYTTINSTATDYYHDWSQYTTTATSSILMPFWRSETFTVYLSPYNDIRQEYPNRRIHRDNRIYQDLYHDISQEFPSHRTRQESPDNRIHQESPDNRIHQESPDNRIHQESPDNRIHQESPDNRIHQEPANHERYQELLEQQKAKAEAKEIARTLLLEHLDDKNKRRLSDAEPLEISSKLFSDIIYHIPISYGKIKAYKENKIIAELCVSVKESELPLEDIILTKLLYLLHDEEHILRTANHSNIQENLLAKLN